MYSCVGIGCNSAFSNDYAIRDDSRREEDFCGSDLEEAGCASEVGDSNLYNMGDPNSLSRLLRCLCGVCHK